MPRCPRRSSAIRTSALTRSAADATRRELRAAYNRALDDMGAEASASCKRLAAARAGRHAGASTRTRCAAATSRGDNYTQIAEPQRRSRRSRAPTLDGLGRDPALRPADENLPGAYPYTGGVYPYRREEEDPIRMFAGEGAPERTNRRFHYLAGGHERDAPVHRVRLDHAVRRRPGHCGPTSTAAPATPASRSPRSTT